MYKTVIPAEGLEDVARRVRAEGKRIVFTNGCFDLLHPGHVALLEASSRMADVLIVAINDDASVRRLKGSSRPVYPANERAETLLGIRWVDLVTVFSEDTPERAIRAVAPDVLVKGAEYGEGEIVGEPFVLSYGGAVERFPMVKEHASSEIVKRIVTPENR